MYYEIHGPAGAQPLVLVHGALATFQSGWQRQLSIFSQKYQVVGLDLRGHGRSNNPAGQLDLRQMANDLLALLRHLGYEKVHLLGFSGGSSVALCFAARHHEYLSSLMLVSNNMDLQDNPSSQNFWDLERVKREEPRWWASLGRMHDQPVEDLFRWWAEEDGHRPNFEAEDLAHVNTPTLLIAGDRDPMIPLRQTMRLFDALPDAYLGVLPATGHDAPQKRPELFNQTILDFLKYVEERQGERQPGPG